MKRLMGLMLLLVSCPGLADRSGAFMGYELLEMSMNEFDHFAGEIGYRFKGGSQLRFTVMDVLLTERHLSSDIEAGAVDGDDVEGVFRGYEINYDQFFSNSHWYYSFNAGYYTDKYQHVKLENEELENNTATVGMGIGYFRRDLFDIKHLYINFYLPVRFYFNRIDERDLGDTTIKDHIIVNNIWLFVGYSF